MTRVTLFEDDEGLLRGYEVEGHSGYDKWGNDIVCAAVSILTINTINAIEAYTQGKPQVSSDETKTRCVFDEPPQEAELLLLKAYELGIRSIEESYGKHVKVKVRRYKSC